MAHLPRSILRQRSLQKGKSSSLIRTSIPQVGQRRSFTNFFFGAMGVFLVLKYSEGGDGESGDHLEVTHICSCNTVAKFQRGNADQQVGECQADTPSIALAVDLTGWQSRGNGYGMHRQCRHQFAEELPPRGLPLRRIGAGHAVRQFDQCNDRGGDFLAGGFAAGLTPRWPGISAFTRFRDEHARVQNQAHGINPMPVESAALDERRLLRQHRGRSPHRWWPVSPPATKRRSLRWCGGAALSKTASLC